MKSEPHALLGAQVRELLGVERAIEQALGRQSELTLAHPELRSSLAAIQVRCGAQGQELERYLHANGLDSTALASPVAKLMEVNDPSETLAHVLCADSAACSFAASGYAVLT